MDSAVADRPKARYSGKGKAEAKSNKGSKPKDPHAKAYKSPTGKFVREYLDDAADECDTVAAVLGALDKSERRAFVAQMVMMCDDYAEALYEDDDEDEDEDYDDE